MKPSNAERTETTAGYVFVLSVVGLAAVFYLGYASFFILQTLCVVCLTMYVSIIGIFLASSSATSVSMGALSSRFLRDVRGTFAHPVSATLATSWIVGSVLLLAFFPREAPVSSEAQAAAPAPAAAVETLTPEQLQEWRAWLDAQPREPQLTAKEPGAVLLTKFNDYQCPSCRQMWLAYRGIIAKYEAEYPDAFTFEKRDYPLESECGPVFNHYGACEAAVAARLAKEKNRFPEMEAWLYDNQATLTRDTIREAVQRIAGVNDYDARYNEVLAKVREDAQLGDKLGVTGTPTFYLNGIKMPGVRAAHFDAAIAYELEKARSKS
jgi:protein-disulfide isomerase